MVLGFVRSAPQRLNDHVLSPSIMKEIPSFPNGTGRRWACSCPKSLTVVVGGLNPVWPWESSSGTRLKGSAALHCAAGAARHSAVLPKRLDWNSEESPRSQDSSLEAKMRLTGLGGGEQGGGVVRGV